MSLWKYPLWAALLQPVPFSVVFWLRPHWLVLFFATNCRFSTDTYAPRSVTFSTYVSRQPSAYIVRTQHLRVSSCSCFPTGNLLLLAKTRHAFLPPLRDMGETDWGPRGNCSSVPGTATGRQVFWTPWTQWSKIYESRLRDRHLRQVRKPSIIGEWRWTLSTTFQTTSFCPDTTFFLRNYNSSRNLPH